MATVTTRGRASGIEPLGAAFDSAAVGGLYERNAGRIFGYCLSRLGRREDAEDAVQTTFLHAIRGLRRGVVPLIESAWLLGIARNVCLARRETFGRRKRLEVVSDPHDIEDIAPAAQTTREELMGLREALAKLPDNQRRAVLLRDWRGLSYEEIATQLEVSHAAVETLIFRGRQNLAEFLGEEPQQTRKRLASLGNVGSFFAAIKTAFTGGVATVKVAAAVVAVSTAGLAVSSLESSAGGSARSEALSVARPGVTQAAGTAPGVSAAPAVASPAVASAVPIAQAQSKSVTGGPKRTPATKPIRRPKSADAASAAAAAAAAAAGENAAGPAGAAAPAAEVTQAPAVKTTAKKGGSIVKEPASALPVAVPPVTPAVQVPGGPPIAVPSISVPSIPVPPVAVPPVSVPPLPIPVPVPPVPAPPVVVKPPTLPPVAPPPVQPVPPVPPVAPPPVPVPPIAAPPVPPPPVAPPLPPAPPVPPPPKLP